MPQVQNVVTPSDPAAVSGNNVKTLSKQERAKELRAEKGKPDLSTNRVDPKAIYFRVFERSSAKASQIATDLKLTMDEVNKVLNDLAAKRLLQNQLIGDAMWWRCTQGKDAVTHVQAEKNFNSAYKQKRASTSDALHTVATAPLTKTPIKEFPPTKSKRAKKPEPKIDQAEAMRLKAEGPKRGRKKLAESMSAEDMQQEIKELLTDLQASTDPEEKKRIRRALRLRGHRGGLQGAPKAE